jgi:1-deoxy-D-xylulose-5-phosphate reductoisomerase
VTYVDGSILAQLGAADMRVPIAHCLGWPGRGTAATQRLDLETLGTLTFEKPDLERFPALGLARRALESGNWATNILNAANEVAVESFLAGEIAFLDIAAIVAEALDQASASHGGERIVSVETALGIDGVGRRYAREGIAKRRRSGSA